MWSAYPEIFIGFYSVSLQNKRPPPVIHFLSMFSKYCLLLLFYLCCCCYCCFFLFSSFFCQDRVFLCSCHWLVTQYADQNHLKLIELLPPTPQVLRLKTCTNPAWLFWGVYFYLSFICLFETCFFCITLAVLNLKFDQDGFEPRQSTCLCVLSDGIQGNYHDTCHQIQFLIFFKIILNFTYMSVWE